MTRKTPVHHKVRDHTRSGVHVHKYERGSGKALELVKMARAGGRGPNYTVTVSGSGRAQSVSVSAQSIPEAVNRGLDKVTVEAPTVVRIRRR